MELKGDALTCVRGGREVFRNVTFNVASGQALVVSGRNGAGKSSLLRAIAGLIRFAAGTLVLSGSDPELPIGEQAHYLGHQDALKPAFTVRENLSFWTEFLGTRRSVDPALQAVDVTRLADMPAGYLSSGQRRRLSIARLIAVPRSLWLLDEPTSSLDTPSQKRLAELMRGHLGSGGIVVAAAHGAIGLERARELNLDPI